LCRTAPWLTKGWGGLQDFATAALGGYSADSLWSKGIDKFTKKAEANATGAGDDAADKNDKKDPDPKDPAKRQP
jgi:hypothetical protein